MFDKDIIRPLFIVRIFFYYLSMDDVNESVDVISFYDKIKRTFLPLRIKWQNRVYKLQKVSHPYTLVEKGDNIWIFNMMSKTTQFILNFNPRTLQWILKGVHDIA